jgi:hypothetical protein
MPVQDDVRERELTQLFNLWVPEQRRRDETDAFLRFAGHKLPFELKSTTSGSVSTVRDFGPDHIAKWKNLHWIFGFYTSDGARLLYCHYASPRDMAPWIQKMEDYVRTDVVLALEASRSVSRDTLDMIFEEKDVYSREEAKSIMKNQWSAEAYRAAQDLPNGYSPGRMVEILKERCRYVIRRGATLNNPHIPKGYFAGWEKITEDHAAKLRTLVQAYLAASTSATDTATA